MGLAGACICPAVKESPKPSPTREEIERQMHELARKYVETHDREIIKKFYALIRELEKMRKSK